MTRFFVLVQHGSHGRLCDFDALRASLVRQFTSIAGCGDGGELQPTHQLQTWGSTVNEGVGTDAGTAACADRLMAELLPQLRVFAGGVAAAASPTTTTTAETSVEQAQRRRCYFSAVGHSFGGIILREVVHRLHTHASCADIRAAFVFLSYVSVATPHCGVTSMNALLRWGGRLIGKVYSSTYSELLLDDPLMHVMSGAAVASASSAGLDPAPASEPSRTSPSAGPSSSYTDSWAAFRRRLLVGCYSHDYLVRFETATLLPMSAVDPSMMAPKPATATSTTTVAAPSIATSTHIGATLHLPRIGADSAAPAAPTAPAPECSATCAYSQLDAASEAIALRLRGRMAFDVMPVFIPDGSRWFCIAHDALMRKGVSAGALPDVVDAVAVEMASDFAAAIERDAVAGP